MRIKGKKATEIIFIMNDVPIRVFKSHHVVILLSLSRRFVKHISHVTSPEAAINCMLIWKNGAKLSFIVLA